MVSFWDVDGMRLLDNQTAGPKKADDLGPAVVDADSSVIRELDELFPADCLFRIFCLHDITNSLQITESVQHVG